jgi:hypothetical protein
VKLAGEAQAEVIKLAALGLAVVAVVWVVRKVAGGVPQAVSDAVDSVMALPVKAADAVAGAAVSAYDAAFKPRVGNDGWQFFPMDGVAIAPDGSYWMGTKKIWSPS